MQLEHPHFKNTIDTDSLELAAVIADIKNVYKNIPETRCLFCPKKQLVEADCCKTFSPPMFLGEFLNIFRETLKLDADKQIDLIVKCCKYHINPASAKPCPLLNGILCSVYEQRPLSCRLYTQYSDNEWDRRLENVKKIMGIETQDIPMHEQCRNIEFVGTKSKLTQNDTDRMFTRLASYDEKLFSDRALAKLLLKSYLTYLTFDAHYLLVYMGPSQLEEMTNMRIYLAKKHQEYAAQVIDKTKLDDIEKQAEDFVNTIEKSLRS